MLMVEEYLILIVCIGLGENFLNSEAILLETALGRMLAKVFWLLFYRNYLNTT